nr:MAG TPA: hypothetical protein [Caudoviricetes sp.]
MKTYISSLFPLRWLQFLCANWQFSTAELVGYIS